MRIFLVAILSVFILFFLGCGHIDEKFISQGTIEYDASAVDQENPMASMAPSKMIVKFKNNNSCAEMSAGMGLFTTSFVCNSQTNSLTQLVKLLNKKFALVLNAGELKKENDEYGIEVIPTSETKVIAGYKCLKAHIKSKDKSCSDFDVFYTQDLDLQNPNFANPFYMIGGVLMEYQLKKFGIEMKFTAKSIKKENIDDSIFDLPMDYKKVSKNEMDTFLKGLQ